MDGSHDGCLPYTGHDKPRRLRDTRCTRECVFGSECGIPSLDVRADREDAWYDCSHVFLFSLSPTAFKQHDSDDSDGDYEGLHASGSSSNLLALATAGRYSSSKGPATTNGKDEAIDGSRLNTSKAREKFRQLKGAGHRLKPGRSTGAAPWP